MTNFKNPEPEVWEPMAGSRERKMHRLFGGSNRVYAGIRMPDMTEIEFNCQKHGVQRYMGVLFRDGSTNPPHCPICVKEQKALEEKAAEIKDDSNSRFRELKSALRDVQAPPFMTLCTFENYAVDPNNAAQVKAFNACKRFAERFLIRETECWELLRERDPQWREKNKRGICMLGTTGVGKTHLAFAICNRMRQDGMHAYYVKVPNLFDALNQDVADVLRIMRALSNVTCLILDEVGVQSDTAATQKRFYQIIDGRIETARPTIVISNLDKEEMNACLTERTVNRIKGSTYPLPMKWESHRARVTGSIEEIF